MIIRSLAWKGGLTACVSCGGAEGGLGLEAGKNSKPEKGLKNAQTPHRQLHALLARF